MSILTTCYLAFLLTLFVFRGYVLTLSAVQRRRMSKLSSDNSICNSITGYDTLQHCSTCSKFFNTKLSLRLHMLDDHGIMPTDNELHRCQYCTRLFLTETENENHMEEVHRSIEGIDELLSTVNFVDTINRISRA